MYSQTNQWQDRPSLFFANLSNADELCSVKVRIDDQQQSLEVIKKIRPQIMKCRELIFTDPLVIASPCLLEDGFIYVVMHQEYWNTGKIQERFKKMGLEYGSAVAITNAVLQACLSYTLRAKVAPLWNKSGEIYIQGRDFLSLSSKCNAVRLELTVSKKEICFAVKPMGIRMPTFQLQDFQICPPVLNHFWKSKDYVIQEFSIDDKWCHVLPSMKKGKMVNITHSIPETSPFKSFKDIRRYWKNMYGYRLPENEAGTIYCNIHFPAIGPTLFTYPHWCVRKFDVHYLPRVDHESVLKTFIMDVQRKVGSICGCQIVLTREPNYPVKCVQEVSSQNFEPTTANLTATSTVLPRSIQHFTASSGSVQQCIKMVERSKQDGDKSKLTQSNMQCTSVSGPTNSQPVHKIIPIFRPNSIINHLPAVSQQTISGAVIAHNPIVPKFKSAQRSVTSDILQSFVMKSNKNTNKNSTIPLFKPAKTMRMVPQQLSQLENRSSLSDIHPTKVIPSFQRMSNERPSTSLVHTPNAVAPSRLSGSRPMVNECTSRQGNSAQGNGATNASVVISSKVVKRKKTQDDDKCSTKKPREKPRVQENVNIQKLALANKLSKVNALTLSVWLKQKGIEMKSKKKADLVARVIEYIKTIEE